MASGAAFGAGACSTSVDVIVSVTTLGSRGGQAATSVGRIVSYLEGNAPERDGRASRAGSAGPELEVAAGPGGYYADSGSGRWLGSGASAGVWDLGERVDRQAFERLLLGQDPRTGEQVMHASGVSRRAHQNASSSPNASPSRTSTSWSDREVSDTGTSAGLSGESQVSSEPSTHPTVGVPGELLEIGGGWVRLIDLADEAKIDDSYLRKTARQTAERIAAHDPTTGDLEHPATHLVATKVAGEWWVERSEADRFLRSRNAQPIVHAYDVTFSTPKSVSVLWAASTPEVQHQIEQALTVAVDAAMAYVEDRGFWVRQGRGAERGEGMVAAAYRHNTSRALEPQLHEHVVVANLALDASKPGGVRAVDARGLLAHATPAGHLANAVLRRELTARIGVEWAPAEPGQISEIQGVPVAAMRAMSTRRAEVVDLAEEVGAFTIRGRQMAALATRAAKDDGVDEAELREGWRTTLTEHGLSAELAAELTPGPTLVREVDVGELFARLSDVESGVVGERAVFDRRHVLAWIADVAGGDLPAGQIGALTDRWLAEHAVPLEVTNTWDTIANRTGARVALTHETQYSTPAMIALEQRVKTIHTAGLERSPIHVPAVTVEHSIRRLEDRLGAELGADQVAAVRAITTSGHQFQAVQGLAGAGKTTAMQAAVDAWHTSGARVIGAAPFAAAARKLGEETGLETRTVASLLTRIDNQGPHRVLDHNTVVLVDEASTLSNVDLDRLYHYAHTTGATVRTVGDPMQHSAVAAHGLWASLTHIHAASTPILDENRRQNPETMAVVRDALDAYRHGDIAGSIDTLNCDGRIKTADTWPEVMDQLVADWHRHHTQALSVGRAPSQMIAERNRDRAALNDLAQTRLQVDGTLGARTDIGGVRFHVGDRVVAQTAGYDLIPPDGSVRDHVINGSVGTITSLAGPRHAHDLVVDFDGLGEIRVPHEWIATEVGAGRGGGLAPAYAITSYKAEGQTFDTALGLAAPGSVDRAGMYVTLTRGRDDLAIYSIDPNHTLARAEAEIPAMADGRSMTQALTDSLTRPESPAVATDADPGIAAALDALGVSDRGRALHEARIAAAAVANPDPTQVARFGTRPPRPGRDQQAWDHAVASEAVYLDRHPVGRDTTGLPYPGGDGHAAVTAAVGRAELAYSAGRPLEDLLADRNPTVVAAAENRIGTLSVAVTRAEQQLALAGNEVARHNHTSNPVPEAVAARYAEAETRLRKARQALTDARANPDPEAVRAAAADKALTWRINTATQTPARYVTDTLGPRPRSGTQRSDWDRAAHYIERVRHNHGLTPNHGPQPGSTPLQRAVGAANTSWKPLVEAIGRLDVTHLSNTVERHPERSR